MGGSFISSGNPHYHQGESRIEILPSHRESVEKDAQVRNAWVSFVYVQSHIEIARPKKIFKKF